VIGIFTRVANVNVIYFPLNYVLLVLVDRLLSFSWQLIASRMSDSGNHVGAYEFVLHLWVQYKNFALILLLPHFKVQCTVMVSAEMLMTEWLSGPVSPMDRISLYYSATTQCA